MDKKNSTLIEPKEYVRKFDSRDLGMFIWGIIVEIMSIFFIFISILIQYVTLKDGIGSEWWVLIFFNFTLIYFILLMYWTFDWFIKRRVYITKNGLLLYKGNDLVFDIPWSNITLVKEGRAGLKYNRRDAIYIYTRAPQETHRIDFISPDDQSKLLGELFPYAINHRFKVD